MAQHISKELGGLQQSGELVEITQLYLEIAEFDLLCAELDPMAVGALLNAYYDGAANRILENNGIVAHFFPGGLSAWFGAPLKDPTHADYACRAALALVGDLPDFVAQRATSRERAMEIHVGLHTDTVFVGIMGGTKRFDYSATGLAVVVAGHLPAIARERAVSVLATAGTIAKLSGAYKLHEIAPIPVPGKDTSMGCYELFGTA